MFEFQIHRTSFCCIASAETLRSSCYKRRFLREMRLEICFQDIFRDSKEMHAICAFTPVISGIYWNTQVMQTKC